MPSAHAVDLTRLWRPIEDSLAEFHGDCNSLVDCTDSILSEVEAIQHELVARARELEQLQVQLELREQQLAEQRTEFGRLSSRFDQQAACLELTTEELGRLRQDLAGHAAPATLAADAARLALEQAGALWQGERAAVLERLNALAMLQPAGAGDSAAVQAFNVNLSQIHELISGSQAAFETQLAQLHDRLQAITEVTTSDAPAHDVENQLSQALAEFYKQLSRQQAQATLSAAQGREELLQRIDSLSAVPREQPLPDVSPLLNELIGQMGAAQEKLDSVRSQAGAGAVSQESLIAELKTELASLHAAIHQPQEPVSTGNDELLAELKTELANLQAAIQQPHEPVSTSNDELLGELKTELARLHAAIQQPHEPISTGNDELLAELRSEVAILRQVAEEARQQTQRQETERTLVEAELDRVRTQAAQWRRELEEASSHHHDEERLWHEELQDLRQLIQQAAVSAAHPVYVESSIPATAAVKAADAHEPADPVANTLLAQFAKLQKDQARRRTRGQ